MNEIRTWHIHIGGQVQGVGFRPFIYQLAHQFGLTGWVNNAADGVHIEFNTEERLAQRFYEAIVANAPRLACVTDHTITRVASVVYDGFVIRPSDNQAPPALLVSPDFALCGQCQHDISDSTNRRYHYAFTTCTQCGPRYSIIRQLPYDRDNTAMAPFAMCSRCAAEYNDPTNRRHFSQTNSCPDCPVVMTLWDNQQRLVENDQAAILGRVCDYWNRGMIVAIKGIGGYVLTCDASSKRAVETLRKRKHRPAKPFALLFPDLTSVEKETYVSRAEATELQSVAAPIVLLRLKPEKTASLARHELAPRLSKIGVMLPYAPIYQLLLQQFDKPVVATSGNLSQAPIVWADDVALNELTAIADYVLVHNRAIGFPQDDSVITYSRHTQQRIILRRARGFAPLYSHRNLSLPRTTILALGAGLKSSFTVVYRQTIHISQYLGNTDNYDAQTNFTTLLTRFLALFGAKPDVILVDEHPGYFTTKLGGQLARKWGCRVVSVPHHEAHFASVLGEHGLLNETEPLLGIIWDGTGLGRDGQIWGGEFFRFHQKRITRVAHFAYFNHFLGDKMATEPRLSAFSLCHDVNEARPIVQPKFSAIEWDNYQKLIAVNTLKTSSVGRLFDGVASLLGLIDQTSYEGEAALLLEETALRYFTNDLTIPALWLEQPTPEQSLSTEYLTKAIVKKITMGESPPEIAAWFHVQLVLSVRSVADFQQCGKLCFSGGVFQNGLLADLLHKLLGADYSIYVNRDVSPNDESISFGQVMWYQAQIKEY